MSGGDLFPLLDLARAGDGSALDRLLGLIRPALLADTTSRLRGRWPEAWTEDVVQEALVDVVRGVRRCRAESEREVRAWLRAILRRQVHLLVRHEHGRIDSTVSLTALGEAASPPESARSVRIQHVLDGLEPVMKDLPVDSARILWMRIQTHASWREVGEELGITASAAKRRYQRLVETLRRRSGMSFRDPPIGGTGPRFA